MGSPFSKEYFFIIIAEIKEFLPAQHRRNSTNTRCRRRGGVSIRQARGPSPSAPACTWEFRLLSLTAFLFGGLRRARMPCYLISKCPGGNHRCRNS
jgi:hypothetical protein